jgi:ligand-binding SRPBCC domain-containing protein
MNILVKSSVNQNKDAVAQGFTEDLFLKLNPPFPPVKLLQFDGCKKDDIVALELNFLLFKQTWKSLITSDFDNQEEWQFVDEGVQLPFFLKYWKHTHRVLETKNGCEIIDDIEYRTPNRFLDILMYPALLLQFLFRKPIYKKVFK